MLQQFVKALVKFAELPSRKLSRVYLGASENLPSQRRLLSRAVCDKPIACAVQVQGESAPLNACFCQTQMANYWRY